ncbi:MAG: oligosaccharide flippase family protein [Candidatus Falkowbacteria bacterium]
MINLIKNNFKKHSETINNFTWRCLQIFGKQGVTFLIFVLCSRLLTPYNFGIYNYILAIIFFLVMFGDFGISTATSKYVAEYNIVNKNKLKAVLFNSGLIIFIITSVITIVTVSIGSFYLKDKYTYFLWLLPLIFLSPMTSLYDGIYRGLKKFKQLAIISLAIGFVSIPFVYFMVNNYGLVGALFSQNIFYLSLLAGLYFGYSDFHFKFNKEVIKEIGKYSFTYGVAVIGYYLFSRVDILILGHYGFIKEIAVYEIINKIFMILLIPFSIIGQIIGPNFTEFYIKKQYNKIYYKLKKYIILSIVSGFIFGVSTYFILPYIIKLFFFNYYNNIFSLIFFPCVIIYSLQVYATYINSGIIVSTGHAKLMTYLNLWLGILNLILALVLIRLFGFVGVIYATMISLIIGIIILHTQYFYIINKLNNDE